MTPYQCVQLLLCLQLMTAGGRSNVPYQFRQLLKAVERHRPEDLRELRQNDLGRLNGPMQIILRKLDNTQTTIAEESIKDIWDLRVFGYSGGYLVFTEAAKRQRDKDEYRKRPVPSAPPPGISQLWLVKATKTWSMRMASRGLSIGTLTATVAALGELSASLRCSRPDEGEDHTQLSRRDIDAFVAHIRCLADRGAITLGSKFHRVHNVARVLRDLRHWGHADGGEQLAGLPASFAITSDDVPPREETSRDEAGQAIPQNVIKQLRSPESIRVLQEAAGLQGVHAIELYWGVGRRPRELVILDYECLAYDEVVEADGSRLQRPVLVHDMPKARVRKYHLPIGEDTANIIREQQRLVRSLFPDTPTIKLKLFPAIFMNPDGTKSRDPQWLAAHVLNPWLTNLPPLLAAGTDEPGYATADPDDGEPIVDEPDEEHEEHETDDYGESTTEANTRISLRKVDERERAKNPHLRLFPKAKIYPYAFRHTWAQLHADEGTPREVLQEMMGHRSPSATDTYFRMPMRRRHDAVRKLARLQITHRGARIHESPVTESQAQVLALGQIIPHGYCAEPANKKAGGDACPINYACSSCRYFSTDATFLPELYEHRKRLIQQRENVLMMMDDPEEAAETAMELGRRIAKYAGLIESCLQSLDSLSNDERIQTLEAIKILRSTRTEYNARIPSHLRGVVREETDITPYMTPAIRAEMNRPSSGVIE
ncbi:hypothetical protein [Kocuria arenosa]|uniref:hypothetical protein n=1 Tax=Kocuria arenosa TaxID=3071446 RepID=UPI0034D71826